MTTAILPSFEYAATDKARDGTFIRIRTIRPDDRDRLIETFRQLSPESIRARWHGAKSALAAGEIAAETDIDPEAHVGLVATVWIDGRERIVGLASYFVDPWTEPRRAEIAFTVLDAWQERGIGTLLFAHLARIARGAGVDELYAEVLSSNHRMLRIIRRSALKAAVDWSGPDVLARVDLGRRVFA
jgi:GNAT superfamily N-acetyltransferase